MQRAQSPGVQFCYQGKEPFGWNCNPFSGQSLSQRQSAHPSSAPPLLFWGVHGGEGSWKQQPGKYIVLWGPARFQLCIVSVFCSEEFRRCVRRQLLLILELCGKVSCVNKTRKLIIGEKGIYFQIYSAEWYLNKICLQSGQMRMPGVSYCGIAATTHKNIYSNNYFLSKADCRRR